jgi:hypothetical protein
MATRAVFIHLTFCRVAKQTCLLGACLFKSVEGAKSMVFHDGLTSLVWRKAEVGSAQTEMAQMALHIHLDLNDPHPARLQICLTTVVVVAFVR